MNYSKCNNGIDRFLNKQNNKPLQDERRYGKDYVQKSLKSGSYYQRLIRFF